MPGYKRLTLLLLLYAHSVCGSPGVSNALAKPIPGRSRGPGLIVPRLRRSYDSPSFVINQTVPTCSSQQGPGVQRDEALGYIKQFCNNTNGMTLGGNSSENYDMGAGIGLNINASIDLTCLGNYTVTQTDCENLFKKTLDGCDVDSYQNKHGGTVSAACGNWTLSVSQHEGELECVGNIPQNPGIDRGNAMQSIQNFCSNSTNFTIGPDSGLFHVYPLSENMQANISVQYNDECLEDPLPYNFTQATCNWLLGRVIDDCNTNSTSAKYGGNVTDHCGIFIFNI